LFFYDVVVTVDGQSKLTDTALIKVCACKSLCIPVSI